LLGGACGPAQTVINKAQAGSRREKGGAKAPQQKGGGRIAGGGSGLGGISGALVSALFFSLLWKSWPATGLGLDDAFTPKCGPGNLAEAEFRVRTQLDGGGGTGVGNPFYEYGWNNKNTVVGTRAPGPE